MTDQPLERRPTVLGRALELPGRLPLWRIVQALCLASAAFFVYQGAKTFDKNNQIVQVNFDDGAPWLGLALLATLVAAWDPALPSRPSTWPAAVFDFVRAHRWELVFLGGILAFGVFMRLYRIGDGLPPSDTICCEEHINGGVAWRTLQGERVLTFPLERYGAAGGFLLFGQDTFGMRFFFIAMGIATLIPFYLLLRQLVSLPAALFGLALYAAAWWPSLFNRASSEGTILAVTFIYFLVRGLKTKSSLMFFAVGVLAALLSYEYEPFKQVPIIAAGFVALAGVREVFLRMPATPAAIGGRAWRLAKDAWRPAIIFAFACAIVLTPMIVAEQQGQDIYLTSVHRQEGERGGSRFTENWRQQVKWSTQLFLPVGPKEYPTQAPLDASKTPLVDPLASWLMLAGLSAALVFFWRPYRLLFATWFIVTLAAGGLLLANFAAWKFFSLAPVAIILATLFVDDLIALARRHWRSWPAYTVPIVLVAAAIYSFWWNADTLFNNVQPRVQEAYGTMHSQFYAQCDYLRDRGEESTNYIFSAAHPILGFARPRDTIEQEMAAWGDFVWACEGLEGTALDGAEHAWPLRDLPEGPVTLAFSGTVGERDELVAQLNRAYPGIGEPDRVIVGPTELYFILGYEFASGSELAQYQGLWASYSGPGATAPVERIEQVQDLQWGETPVPPPFEAHFQGVIYQGEAGPWTLQALSADPVEVRLGGQVVYSSLPGSPTAQTMELMPGWHAIEIRVTKNVSGGDLALQWVSQDGRRRAVERQDLFALRSLGGWVHTETVAFPTNSTQAVTERFDFAPHYVSAGVVKIKAEQEAGQLAAVQEERWRGIWRIDRQQAYILRAEYLGGQLELRIDGEPVPTGPATIQGPRPAVEAPVNLPVGEHIIELVQTHDDSTWSGATLALYRLTPSPTAGQPPQPTLVALDVTPY